MGENVCLTKQVLVAFDLISNLVTLSFSDEAVSIEKESAYLWLVYIRLLSRELFFWLLWHLRPSKMTTRRRSWLWRGSGCRWHRLVDLRVHLHLVVVWCRHLGSFLHEDFSDIAIDRLFFFFQRLFFTRAAHARDGLNDPGSSHSLKWKSRYIHTHTMWTGRSYLIVSGIWNCARLLLISPAYQVVSHLLIKDPVL